MDGRFKLKPPKELVTAAFTAALLLILCALLKGEKPEKGPRENTNVTKQEDDRERVVQSNIEFKRNIEFQTNMEFWKATHDYFQQYATISLASIAAFAVLLGGAFANPPDDANLDFIRWFAPEWVAARPWIFGWARRLFILATFVAFGVSGYYSVQGTHKCRDQIWHLRNVTNGVEQRIQAGKIGRHYRRTHVGRWYTAGIITFSPVALTSLF